MFEKFQYLFVVVFYMLFLFRKIVWPPTATTTHNRHEWKNVQKSEENKKKNKQTPNHEKCLFQNNRYKKRRRRRRGTEASIDTLEIVSYLRVWHPQWKCLLIFMSILFLFIVVVGSFFSLSLCC